jgi:hypothetical protein
MLQCEFARYRGVAPKTVRQWRQRGQIVMHHPGTLGELIDFEASDRALDELRPRSYRGGVASQKPD